MATYKCKLCGEQGYSKNIACRNFFPDDGMAAVMTNICNVITKFDEGKGRRVVTLEFPYADVKPLQPDHELEFDVIRSLQTLPEETLRHWLCPHEFELIEGEPIQC